MNRDTRHLIGSIALLTAGSVHFAISNYLPPGWSGFAAAIVGVILLCFGFLGIISGD